MEPLRVTRRRPWGEVAVTTDPSFLATARAQQRDWLMYRFLSEAVADLEALDTATSTFVDGSFRPQIHTAWQDARAVVNDIELMIEGQQVMQAWERPLMEAMAAAVAAPEHDLLEIGFGMGISATVLQKLGIRSHTIIECNDNVLARAERWKAQFPDSDIRLVSGRWQDVLDCGRFDAAFYDPYPTTEAEFEELVRTPFPESFLSAVPTVMNAGGLVTYYSNECDSLSRWHQRVLLREFAAFRVSVIDGLRPPEDCNYWSARSMAVVVAEAHGAPGAACRWASSRR